MTFFNYSESENSAKIKVIGVGGAGGHAINNMIAGNLNGVKFISANTDSQALDVSKADVRILLGTKITEGLGAGADPRVGRDAALENVETIKEALFNSHMVFIIAGFGGGTGTGAVPVIARLCKEMGILTVAVVTRPFSFEGRKRAKQAEEGFLELKEVVDTAFIIPNDRLRGLSPKNARMIDLFKIADEMMLHSVKGITDLIMMPGKVNLDFADVKTTMSRAGMAIMGIGISSGENRALEAAERAISHPLLDDINISGAKGVLMNITSNSDLTMEEMTEASERIYNEVGEEAEIIWGAVIDDSVGEEMSVTVFATGIGEKGKEKETPTRALDPTYGGKVRDITPADLARSSELDEPTFIRRRQAVNEGAASELYREYKGIVIDNDDLDVPTFLRKKADSTYNKESIDNTKHGTYRVDDIENSSVWKEGYTIFNSSLNENEKSKKLKTYRDYLLNIKSNPVDKEVFLEKSISLINNLWMLSKNNNNVPEFVNFIISLLNDIEENNLTNILYSFYSFIDFSIQIKSARQISNTQLLALDKEMLENFSNNLIQFPKQIVEINKCIEMMPDESLKISKRMRYKVVINDLKTIYESLNGAKKTPEVICLIYTIKIWIKLLEDALSLVLKRIECKIVFNDTIFFNKWNNIEIEVYGGYSEDYFEIKMLPISDYDVEIEEHIVHFEDKKECGSFNLKIKPKKIGDLRLVFTIDTRAFTLPINVIPLNPFVVGRPIKCSDMFFGREELLNEIIRGLLSPSSINYILTGRRRIGKTSFLYALKRNLPQYVLPVLISMEVSDEKLNNIFQLFINEIIFSLKEREIIINKDLMDTKIDKKDPSNSFLDWLRRLIPELMINSIKRIYILIDEALIITELNQHAQSLFRYIFSNIDGIGGILASPPDIIKRLNYSVSSPWYNIFKTAKIGPFTKEETKTLIESNLKNYNIEKVDKIAEKTYQYSGGLPYYVQAIGYELIENYHHLEKHDDLFRLSINGLKHKLSTSYPVVLENLSPIEKIAIVSIANNFHPPDVCTKKLFEADLIIQLKEGWEIPSKIEKEWIINLSERLLNSAGESLWKKYGNHLEFPKLVTEIEMVLKELSKKKTKNDSLIVALDAAKAKDGAKVLGYLGLAGKKVLDAASKIGTEVAAEYIKASLGLK